eukprot:GCRY01000545.1.p1 GENE.GCRY01000545.1~~GCRY01000545.1.p1  ORF type:complete len:552 (-),score=133.76 GCRY01000545.1:71-1726(-)
MKLSISVLLFLLGTIVASSLASFHKPQLSGTAFAYVNGKIVADPDASVLRSAVAVAFWNDTCLTTGWGELAITTNKAYSNEQQVYAAGFLEGALTQKRIHQAQQNLFFNVFGKNMTVPSKLVDFMNDQIAFLKHPNHPSDKQLQKNLHFRQLVFRQFEGLVAGYQAEAPASEMLSFMDLYLHNSAGDLEDLAPWFSETKFTRSPFPGDLDPLQLDCSSIIKLTPTDLFAAQGTWRGFGCMAPRIYKFYFFELEHAANTAIQFSSTPGFISSKDDFYITKHCVLDPVSRTQTCQPDQGLVVMETTNAIFNKDLYNRLTPKCFLTWQRTMGAMFVAETGEDWGRLFIEDNSGTYNNQWMIVNYGEYVAGLPLSGRVLYVIEQIPGDYEGAYVDHILMHQGYWGSYNIPFFERIYNASGYNTKPGNTNSYEHCPRANIFRHQHARITDMTGMQWIMQYNEYQTDPDALGQPNNAIASRYDLRSPNPAPFGSIDAKITSAVWANSLRSRAIAGPTRQDQPAFHWDENQAFAETLHLGHPNIFEYDWVDMYFPSQN